MTNPPQPDAQAAQDALVGMISEDREVVTRAIETLVEHGAKSVYAALCGWASVTASQMIPDEGEDDSDGWYLEVIDEGSGEQVNIDDTGLPRAVRDAIRMVTLFKNDDHEMMQALFRPYWMGESKEESEELVTLMLTMLQFAAAAARHHMEAKHDAGECSHNHAREADAPLRPDHPDYAAMTATLRKFKKNANHKTCPRILKECMAAGGVEITVSTCRPLVHGRYTSDPYICPHGTRFWVEPTGEQIARWAKEETP